MVKQYLKMIMIHSSDNFGVVTHKNLLLSTLENWTFQRNFNAFHVFDSKFEVMNPKLKEVFLPNLNLIMFKTLKILTAFRESLIFWILPSLAKC